MPVVIGEIVTEVVVSARAEAAGAAGSPGGAADDELVETVVRRATERVLARLRLEWDR